MFAKLSELGVEVDVLQLIEDLYQNANGQLRWKGQLAQIFETPAGVRQGCPISPTLFSLYTECLMGEWYFRTAHLRAPRHEWSQHQRAEIC